MKKYKILCIAPQNPLPYTDGGKIGIFFPLKYLAKYNDLYFSCPVQKINNNDIRNYKEYNIKFFPYFLNTKDNYKFYFKSLFTQRSFKLEKYYNKKYLKYLVNLVNENNIEILWINSLHMGIYGIKLKKYYPHLKIFLREHNIEYELVRQYSKHCNNIFIKFISYLEYLKTKRYEINTCKKFDKTYFISDSDLEIAKTFGNYSQDNLIYDGVEIENNLNIDCEDNSFIFTGSLSSFQNGKNLNNFIKNIWKPFINRYPQNKLYITGNTNKMLHDKLNLSVNDLHDMNIYNLGFVENIKETIQSKKYIVSPTLCGSGIRLKVLEGLSLKRPIFVLDTDFLMCNKFKDLVNIIHYSTVENFCSKYLLLENDKKLYDKICNNGFKLAKEVFSWQIYVEKLLKDFQTT